MIDPRILIRRNRFARCVEAMRCERNVAACAFVFTLVLSATSVCAQLVPGSMDVRWDAGRPDCKTNSQAPIQVHRCQSETFPLRQNLCVSFEGNFLYILIGSRKALLIDSGAIADPARMPVARTVLDLLPARGDSRNSLTGSPYAWA
jgi:hydroxyacylglutathione hydrolase